MTLGSKKIDLLIRILRKTLFISLGLTLISQIALANQATELELYANNQEKNFSVNFENEPLENALQLLARKANVGISFETESIPKILVSYRSEDTTVFEVLNAILDGTRLYSDLSEDRKVIFIKESPVSPPSQQFTISGTVTDASSNETLPGVNINVKGTTVGTSTNTVGEYELVVESLQDTLVFSFVGYQSREVPIQGRTNIDVGLNVTTEVLGEMVVTGLATSVKRENLANSVTKVDAEELMGGTTPSTTDGALAGKVVGANISSTGGAPGGGMDFKLRGISTLGSGSSQPLIIVDGVYLNNNQLQNGLSAVSQIPDPSQDDGANRLADLNPDDIQSIEVLKGPSAAAIYGARANAGVVIIKTKRGQAGVTQVSFDQSIGYSSILNKLDQPSWSENKIDLVYGAGTSLAQAARQMYSNAVSNNNLHDYQEVILGNKGSLINTGIKVSGGDPQTQFLLSGEFNRDEGIIENTSFGRFSIRANIDHHFGKNITVRSSSNYINSENKRGWTGNGGVGSVVYALAYTPPFAQILPNDEGDYPSNPFYQMNPLELIDYGENDQNVNRFLQSVSSDIGLYSDENSDLTLKVEGGVDYLGSTSLVYQPEFIQYQQNQTNPGDVIQTTDKNLNINLTAFFVYNKTFGSESEQWDLTTQLGYTNFYRKQERQQNRGRGLISGQTNVENATVQEIFNQYTLEVTDVGFVGQQQVNWSDKIIGTIGARFDKSTLNMKQDEYYFFPKASLAVNLTNFEFWKSNLFSQFKLRTAYGETGGLPNFGVIFNELSSGNIDGSLGTFRSTRTIDPDLEPETAQELEVGADIGFFENRVSFEMTYYQKNVEDLILDQEIPSSSGLQVQATNAANLRNRGIELSLNLIPLERKNIVWNSTINWSKNNAEITSMEVSSFTTGGFGASLGTLYLAEGFSPTTIVGTPFNEGAGRYTIYGDNQPDFQMSFLNEISFLQNWSFSALWQLKYGQKTINLLRFLQDLNGTTSDWNEDYNNDGTPNGLDREGEGAGRYIEDATYLKLSQASLYYSVPSSFLNELSGNSVKQVRLGVSGNNLLLFSPYSGYDPETSEFGATALQTGISVAPYPSTRQLMFHINLDF